MSTLLLRNPRLLVVVILLILAAGVSSVLTIVRQEDPTISNGIAVVVTPFPGASAERVETLVTDKLEDQLRELSEIEVLNSTSKNGVSVIAIELDETIHGKDVEEAFSRIRDALGDASAHFPAGVGAPIFDDARFGSYTLIVGVNWALASPPRHGIVARLADDLQDRLRNIPGTDVVRVFGAATEEITVRFDPDELASAGLTASQVSDAIVGGDAKVASGVIRGVGKSISLELTGAIDSLERIRNVPLVTRSSGATLQVGDIAEVNRTVREPRTDIAISNGKTSVVVAAQLARGQRFDTWATGAHAMLDRFRKNLPSGLELDVVFDQSRYTQLRLTSLIESVLTGLLLVVLVLFVTLGWRSALIVATALPLVSFASLAVLNKLGVPIHQMSVAGLIVALGLLVDNAIVIVDSVQARRHQGHSPFEAVRGSLRHLWVPLFSSTLTTVLAFLPILLLSGRVGEFVSAIGLSVIVALICSYVIGMTIVAALAGRFLKPNLAVQGGFWINGIHWPAVSGVFSRSIGWSLHNPKTSIALTLVLPIAGFVGALTLQKQFFPPADRDHFHIELRLPEQAAIDETVRATRSIDVALKAHAEVESIHWFVGRSAPPNYYNLKQEQDGTPSYAQAHVRLTSIDAVQRLLPRLQDELDAVVPQAQILVRELLQGPPVDSPIEVRVYGPDLDQLRRIGEEFRQRMSSMASVTHTLATLTAGSSKIWLKANESEAALAGLKLVNVAKQLDAHLEGVAAGSLLEGTEEIPIRVRVGDVTRTNLGRLGSMQVQTQSLAEGGARSIPLSSLVDLELSPALAGIPHRNGERVDVIRGFTRAGVYPETAFSEFSEVILKNPVQLPAGYRVESGGDAEKRGKAIGGLLATVPVLIILMIATVALGMGSFRLGAVVLVVAGSSVGLGLLSLAVLRHPLGFIAMIGLIGLIGVAINAAIVINSALRACPEAVNGSVSAIRKVVVGETSRHIVSTTITTFGGFLPLILADGGFWPPFATGIAGGVVLSTVVSFYLVPASFLMITRWRPVASSDDSRAQALLSNRTTVTLEVV